MRGDRTDVLRVFDYALSDEEIEMLLSHDSGDHENEEHPDCPVCQANDVNVIE